MRLDFNLEEVGECRWLGREWKEMAAVGKCLSEFSGVLGMDGPAFTASGQLKHTDG